MESLHGLEGSGFRVWSFWGLELEDLGVRISGFRILGLRILRFKG